MAAAINSYFYNLNTFYVYEDLRQLRAKRRAEGEVAGHHLVTGLSRYSERGLDYVKEIHTMLKANTKHIDS